MIYLVGGAKGDQVLHWDGTSLHQTSIKHLLLSSDLAHANDIFTNIRHRFAHNLMSPYKESTLADTDGIVAISHQRVRQQLFAHPVNLIEKNRYSKHKSKHLKGRFKGTLPCMRELVQEFVAKNKI